MHWVIRHRTTGQYLTAYANGHSAGRHWSDNGDEGKAFEEEPEAAAVVKSEDIGHMTEVVGWPGVTFLVIGLARLAAKGKPAGDALSGSDLESVQIAMFGGCHGCGESLGAYNGYPDRATGYWACKGCLREPFPTVAVFDAEYPLEDS